MLKCPNCGEENPNTQKFCSICRTELTHKGYSEILDMEIN